MKADVIEGKTRPHLAKTIFGMLLTITLVLAAALAGSSRSAQARPPVSPVANGHVAAPTTEGRIVFMGIRDGQGASDIYTTGIDGIDTRRLTTGGIPG
jgi:CHASE2 domain-containing sensor protein